MKNLIEVSKIITMKKIRKIEIFDDNSLKNKSSKFNEFYDQLTSNKFRNDRDAATALYGCSPKDARYRQLKSRFRRRLLNTLFFLDINKAQTSNYDRALYTCHREWAQIMILQQYQAHQSAESLTKSLFTVAQKYNLTDIALNCLRLLREYAAGVGDSKAYTEYNNRAEEYSRIQRAEMQAEELYQQVMIDYMRTLGIDEETDKRIEQYSNTLLALSEEFSSSTIMLHAYLVWAIRFEMRNDHDTLLEICDRAIQAIESSPDNYPQDKLLNFQTKKMLAYLHLQDYNKGQRSAEGVLQGCKEGTEEWLHFMEYYLLLALHTAQYIQALAIFNRAATKTSFRKLDSRLRDRWSLYEAYIHFANSLTHVGAKVAALRGMKGFQLASFLQDEQGIVPKGKVLQLMSIVLQIMFLLQKRKLNLVDAQIQKLQYIANRQLKKGVHNRHIQFVRLLQQLRKANYDLEELKGTEKYLQRMANTPFRYRGLTEQLEIIPYEQLWPLVTTALTPAQ